MPSLISPFSTNPTPALNSSCQTLDFIFLEAEFTCWQPPLLTVPKPRQIDSNPKSNFRNYCILLRGFSSQQEIYCQKRLSLQPGTAASDKQHGAGLDTTALCCLVTAGTLSCQLVTLGPQPISPAKSPQGLQFSLPPFASFSMNMHLLSSFSLVMQPEQDKLVCSNILFKFFQGPGELTLL